MLNQVLKAAEISKKLSPMDVKPYKVGEFEEGKADDVPI